MVADAAKEGGKEIGKLLFHGHKVSAWDDEKVLKMRQGLHDMKMINDTKRHAKIS